MDKILFIGSFSRLAPFPYAVTIINLTSIQMLLDQILTAGHDPVRVLTVKGWAVNGEPNPFNRHEKAVLHPGGTVNEVARFYLKSLIPNVSPAFAFKDVEELVMLLVYMDKRFRLWLGLHHKGGSVFAVHQEGALQLSLRRDGITLYHFGYIPDISRFHVLTPVFQ